MQVYVRLCGRSLHPKFKVDHNKKLDDFSTAIKYHCVKCVRIRSYSGPHFPAFGLNISPYSVRMRENADQNNSAYGHFSRTECFLFIIKYLILIPLQNCLRCKIKATVELKYPFIEKKSIYLFEYGYQKLPFLFLSW